MEWLAQRFDAGEIVILDGATGTELQRRGVPMHEEAWSAGALRSHPGDVQAVHEDYIRAGADVIFTNTFGTNRALLARAGLAHPPPTPDEWRERPSSRSLRAQGRVGAARDLSPHGDAMLAPGPKESGAALVAEKHRPGRPARDEARARANLHGGWESALGKR